MSNSFTISTNIILNEAKKRKIVAEPIGETKIIKLSLGDHSEYLCNQFISKSTAVAVNILDNKDKTKVFLSEKGISVAKGRKFNISEEQKAREFAQDVGFPLVMKPTNSSHGNNVYTNIMSLADFDMHWQKISDTFQDFLIEKQFVSGTEYRIIATRDKVVAVTNRVPANVEGDAVHSIKELIDIKNSDPRRGDDSYKDYSKPLVKINIDDVVRENLKSQHKSLDFIPQKGEVIFLRQNSNLSTGGDSIDFTDKIHSSVKEIAVRAINAIPGLSYGGVDFLTTDITKNQDKNSYIIVEINSSPGIFMHHFPYQGKPRNVAGEILNIAFPEAKEEIQ